jgi:hypothetical protein
MEKLELWHAELRPLVELHGANHVNNAGIDALGFPGILAECPHEIEAIRQALVPLMREKEEAQNGR